MEKCAVNCKEMHCLSPQEEAYFKVSVRGGIGSLENGNYVI
jgi:hypothetical protein